MSFQLRLVYFVLKNWIWAAVGKKRSQLHGWVAAQEHFAVLKGGLWGKSLPQPEPPWQTQLGVPVRFTHGQEWVFDWARKDQTRWNIAASITRHRHKKQILKDWQIQTSKFSLTPERQQDVLINHSDKTAVFRGPQLEQKSHWGKHLEVGIWDNRCWNFWQHAAEF